MAGIVRAHTHGQKIKETVSERQQIEPFGPPCPEHLKGYSSLHVENIPRLIPAALNFQKALVPPQLSKHMRVGKYFAS